MKKWAILGAAALAVLATVLVTVVWGSAVYNNLVTTSESVDASWAQVENVLQRRYDLIPNLVNTVKGYAKHEKETLENIAKFRSQWGAAQGAGEKIEASRGLEGALSRLLVVLERYPDLKANQNFLKLQDELAGTENRIAVERLRYNESVQSYNLMCRRFPGNLIAGIFGFQKKESYFEAKEAAKETPKVEF
jgi:LemA protein